MSVFRSPRLCNHEVGLEDAANLLGVSVDRLLALAGEALIPGATLTLNVGWRFNRKALEQLKVRGIPELPAEAA